MRHQIGVVQTGATGRDQIDSRFSRLRRSICGEARFTVATNTPHAAPPPVFLCGFGLCILWLWFPFRTQKTQTKATDGSLVFFFSPSEVKNISTTDATVFDGSGRPHRMLRPC